VTRGADVTPATSCFAQMPSAGTDTLPTLGDAATGSAEQRGSLMNAEGPAPIGRARPGVRPRSPHVPRVVRGSRHAVRGPGTGVRGARRRLRLPGRRVRAGCTDLVAASTTPAEPAAPARDAPTTAPATATPAVPMHVVSTPPAPSVDVVGAGPPRARPNPPRRRVTPTATRRCPPPAPHRPAGSSGAPRTTNRSTPTAP